MIQEKANTTYVLVSVIVSILAFIIYLNFIVFSQDIISSEIDDRYCQAFISVNSGISSFDPLRLTDFFNVLQVRCKNDIISSRASSEEEVYSLLSERMLSCWNRYGRGEYDFMSNYDTEGQWCFTCAKISFDRNSEVYDYRDFINYLNETRIRTSQGEETYFNLMNLKFVSYEDGEIMEIMEVFNVVGDALRAERIVETNELLFYIDEEALKFQDLASKKIDTSDGIYLVYRYDRLSNDLLTTFENTAYQVGISVGVGGVVGLGVGALIGGPLGIFVSVSRNLIRAEKLTTVYRVLGSFSHRNIILMSGAVSAGGFGAVGGVVGLGINDNYVQYVDVMGREEYYRVCGAEPIFN